MREPSVSVCEFVYNFRMYITQFSRYNRMLFILHSCTQNCMYTMTGITNTAAAAATTAIATASSENGFELRDIPK